MSQGANSFFNVITAIFVVLTVLIIVIVLGVASNAMDPPILAPEDTAIPPTEWQAPTEEPPAVEATEEAGGAGEMGDEGDVTTPAEDSSSPGETG